MKHGICEDIRHFSIEFCVSGVQRLSQGFERMLIMKELSWKNKLRFVKDVPMICVNLVIIVILVPEKRKDYFCTTLFYHEMLSL